MTGIRVGPQSYGAIEEAAASVRRIVNPELNAAGQVSGEHLFERIDSIRVRGTPLTYGVKDAEEIGNTEALTSYLPDSDRVAIFLATRVYQALCAGQPRALFTLIHELGHAVLHLPFLKVARMLPHGLARGGSHPTYEDSEWQADAFAAAFLMPASEIDERRLRTPEQVQETFGVSQAAAEARWRVFSAHRDKLLRGGRDRRP